MDDADRAVDQQEHLLAATIKHRPRQGARTEPGLACLACGEEIPEARRRALPGACLCIDCQEDAEQVMR